MTHDEYRDQAWGIARLTMDVPAHDKPKVTRDLIAKLDCPPSLAVCLRYDVPACRRVLLYARKHGRDAVPDAADPSGYRFKVLP